MIQSMFPLLLLGLSPAIRTPDPVPGPVQTTQQSYPSVDGGEVTCLPNGTDSPRGKESRERLLTRGPKVEFSTLVAPTRNPGDNSGAAPMLDVQRMIAEQRANDWAYRCRYRQDNARIRSAHDRPSIVFIGDSLTENWPVADPSFFAPYVGRGVSGQTSSQMLNRFYGDVVSLHPRIVHIMAGTNDVNGATGPSTQDDVVENVLAMIDLATFNGIRVILASIPPNARSIRHPEFKPDNSITQLNQRLAAIARERHLTYVDYYSVLTDGQGRMEENLSNDGLHPNRAGYERMEVLTRKAIHQLRKQSNIRP